MNRRHAALFEFLLQAAVEIGRVYSNQNMRPVLQEVIAQLAADPDNLRQTSQYFDITMHCKLFHGKQRMHARCQHFRPAYAGKLRLRQTGFQGTDKMTTKLVAGCFCSNDADIGESSARGLHLADDTALALLKKFDQYAQFWALWQLCCYSLFRFIHG